MKRVLSFLAVLLLCVCSGNAATWTTNGSWAALNYISTNCSPGDTINVTPGTNIWTQHIGFYDVQLVFSGTNTSEVIDETPITGIGDSLLEFTTGPQFWRISGCTFHVGVTNNYNTVSVQVGNASAAVRGNINIYGTNVGRVDDNVFYQLTGKPIHFTSLNYSVVDHDSIQMYGNANAMECEGGNSADNGQGDFSWSIPGTWGTSNALYIEDCYIYSAFQFASIDYFEGARVVIRNCHFANGTFPFCHGFDSGQRYDGGFSMECYSNLFDYGGSIGYNEFAMTIHSGSALIHDNTISNYQYVASISNDRSVANLSAWTPWYGATGLMGCDSNSPTLLSGTVVTATNSNTLIVGGATWATNQWLGAEVYNLTKQLNGCVAFNDASNMTFSTAYGFPSYQMSFSNGDQYVVHFVVPIGQPGRGYGSLLVGPAPTNSWSGEVLSPIYAWNNNISFAGGALAPAYISSQCSTIQLGRDITNAALASYTPFIYPNPLTGLMNSGGGGSTNGPTLYQMNWQFLH